MGRKYDFGFCRDCGKKTGVSHWKWERHAIPRCRWCGGVLDQSDAAWLERQAIEEVRKELEAGRADNQAVRL